MQSRRWMGWAAILVATATVVISIGSRSEAQDGGKAGAPAWEYRVVLLTDVVSAEQNAAKQVTGLESKLNELGRDGWELSEQLHQVIVFKRPRK